MGHISVALVSAIGDRIAGAPISYALRTARDSENFHAGAAAQILFMEPDTAGDFHIALSVRKYVCTYVYGTCS